MLHLWSCACWSADLRLLFVVEIRSLSKERGATVFHGGTLDPPFPPDFSSESEQKLPHYTL